MMSFTTSGTAQAIDIKCFVWAMSVIERQDEIKFGSRLVIWGGLWLMLSTYSLNHWLLLD